MRVTTVTSAYPCLGLFVLLGCSLSFSVGELNFDLFLTSSNNLTATVDAATVDAAKKMQMFQALVESAITPVGEQRIQLV